MSNTARVALAAIAALVIANLALVASQWPAPRLRESQRQSDKHRNKDQPKAQGAAAPYDQHESEHRQNESNDVATDNGWWAWFVSMLPIPLLAAIAAMGSAAIAFTLVRHHWSVGRPWVVLTVACDNVMQSLQSAQPPPGMKYVVKCAVTNYGSVPGWLLKGHTALRVVHHPLDSAEPRSRAAIRQLMRDTPLFPLRPGREDAHAFDTVHDLTQDEWTALQGRCASVVFFAFFKYRGARTRWLFAYPDAWFAWDWTLGETPPGAVSQAVWKGPAEPRHWTRYT